MGNQHAPLKRWSASLQTSKVPGAAGGVCCSLCFEVLVRHQGPGLAAPGWSIWDQCVWGKFSHSPHPTPSIPSLPMMDLFQTSMCNFWSRLSFVEVADSFSMSICKTFACGQYWQQNGDTNLQSKLKTCKRFFAELLLLPEQQEPKPDACASTIYQFSVTIGWPVWLIS